jgi:hypothetical protein
MADTIFTYHVPLADKAAPPPYTSPGLGARCEIVGVGPRHPDAQRRAL